MATDTLAPVDGAPTLAIKQSLCRAGVIATIEISDLAGSIQRLVQNEEQGDITAILLLARRIDALSSPLHAILDGQELQDNEAEAIGYDAEAAT